VSCCSSRKDNEPRGTWNFPKHAGSTFRCSFEERILGSSEVRFVQLGRSGLEREDTVFHLYCHKACSQGVETRKQALATLERDIVLLQLVTHFSAPSWKPCAWTPSTPRSSDAARALQCRLRMRTQRSELLNRIVPGFTMSMVNRARLNGSVLEVCQQEEGRVERLRRTCTWSESKWRAITERSIICKAPSEPQGRRRRENLSGGRQQNRVRHELAHHGI
jgi:hypothetical protein